MSSVIQQMLFFKGATSSASISTTVGSDLITAVINTVHTHSTMSLGTATSDRIIIVGISIEPNGAIGTISSVTIGGVTATAIVNAASASEVSAIYAAAVPSGTTGDVVITNSASLYATAITVWRMVGGLITPTNTGTSTATRPASVNLNINAGGVAVGAVVHRSVTGTTFTWANLTEDSDLEMTSNDEYATAASAAFAATQTGLTITATANNAGTRPPVMCVASFPPA